MALVPFRSIAPEDDEYGMLAVEEYQDTDTGEVIPLEQSEALGMGLPVGQAPLDPMGQATAKHSGNASTSGGELTGASYQDRLQSGQLGNPADAPYQAPATRSDATSTQAEEQPIKLNPRREPAPWYEGEEQPRGGGGQLPEMPQPRTYYQAPTQGGFQDKSRKFKGAPGQAERIQQSGRSADDTMAQALQNRFDIQSEQVQAEAKRERDRSLHAAMRADVMQTQLQEKNNYVKNKTNAFQKRRDAIRKTPVSATIYEGDAGKTVLAALAMAFGQYGAAMTGGPNSAASIIQQANEAHVDEQMRLLEEGSRGVDAEEKAMWDEMRRAGNSPEQIREQMLLVRSEQSQAALRAMAADDRYGELRAEFGVELAQLQQDAVKREADLMSQVGAEYSQEYKPGRSGGMVTDWGGYEKQMEMYEKRLDLAMKEQKLQGEGEAGIDPKRMNEVRQAYEKNKIVDEEIGIHTAQRLIEGMLKDGVTEFETPESRNLGARVGRWGQDFVAGKGSATDSWDTPEERSLNRIHARLKDALYQSRTGAAVTEADDRRLSREIENIRTIEDAQRFLEESIVANQDRKRSVAASLDPAAVRAREERKRRFDARYQQQLEYGDPIPEPEPRP